MIWHYRRILKEIVVPCFSKINYISLSKVVRLALTWRETVVFGPIQQYKEIKKVEKKGVLTNIQFCFIIIRKKADIFSES
jgi:hypothetical protein